MNDFLSLFDFPTLWRREIKRMLEENVAKRFFFEIYDVRVFDSGDY